MYLFYKARPESVVGSINSLMNIDSRVFSNGVSIWVEESSGLSIYINDGVQNEFDVTKCSILTIAKQTLLHTSDSEFSENVGGGINIELYMGYTNTKYQVAKKPMPNWKWHKNRTINPMYSSDYQILKCWSKTQSLCMIQ